MTEFVNVKGFKELQTFLDQLPAKMEANVMRSALRAGAKVVLEEAKLQVPVRHGYLKKSLRIGTKSRRGTVTAEVKTKVYYAKWVEYGTAAHGKHPGATPKPFMRPALDTKSNAALLAVGEAIKKRLAKKHGLDASGVDLEIN